MSADHTPREDTDTREASRNSSGDAPLLAGGPADGATEPSTPATQRCVWVGSCWLKFRALLRRHDLERFTSSPRRGFLRAALWVIFLCQPIVCAINAAAFIYGGLQFNHHFAALQPPAIQHNDDFPYLLIACGWVIVLPWLNFLGWYLPLYVALKDSPLPSEANEDASAGDVEKLIADASADAPAWIGWGLPARWSWVARDVVVPLNGEVEWGDLQLRVQHHVPQPLGMRRRGLHIISLCGLAASMVACVVGATGPRDLGAGGVLYAVAWHHRVARWSVLAGSGDAESVFYQIAAVSIASIGCWAIQFVLLGVIFLRVSKALAHSKCYLPAIVGGLFFGSLVALMVLGLFFSSAVPQPGRNPADLPSRGLCFRNSCGETIRIGQIGGSTGIPCSPACPKGTVCNPADDKCYFDLQLSESELFLGPGGQYCHPFEFAPITTTVHPVTGVVHPVVQWSGALYASGGCHGGACATAICDGCTSYQGPVGPVTQAEMTLAPTDKDYFDVTIINGANFPLSVTPMSPTGTFAPDPHTPDAYHCRAPGSPFAVQDTPGASWHFQQGAAMTNRSLLPMVSYTEGATTCESDADCSGGDVCGTAMATLAGKKPLNFVHASICGALLGVWSRDELCGWTDAIHFGTCKDQITAPITMQVGNVEQLFQCNPPFGQSCFQKNVNEACCGCSVWDDFIPVHTANCTTFNPLWATIAKPHIEVLKRACPTCYTYPYDDATSLFTCWSNATHNENSYMVEWCPSGTSIRTS